MIEEATSTALKVIEEIKEPEPPVDEPLIETTPESTPPPAEILAPEPAVDPPTEIIDELTNDVL